MFKSLIPLIPAFALTCLLRAELKHTDEKILPPPSGMEHYTFGFDETMSDLLWLRFIQDAYVCAENDQCSEKWGYQMLNQASILAPRFRSLYTFGASNVSVILDDDDGAKVLYDRGLLYFPNDWEVNYRAGYHYLVELDEPARAAELFNVASQNGAPFWTRSLSARLYDRIGQLEVSERLLKEMKEYSLDEEWEKAINDRLKDVQKKMAEQRNSRHL